jgi:hypothetical protein
MDGIASGIWRVVEVKEILTEWMCGLMLIALCAEFEARVTESIVKLKSSMGLLKDM